MKIDFKSIQEAADRHAAETDQAFKDGFRERREKREAKDREIERLLSKNAERESDRKHQEMEHKIQEEINASTEAIRAKYAKESPASWNEGRAEKAIKKLAENLKV